MKKETREILGSLIDLQDRIKELEQINEEHCKINGELRKTINEAIEKAERLQKTYSYELSDLIFLLQGKSDE